MVYDEVCYIIHFPSLGSSETTMTLMPMKGVE